MNTVYIDDRLTQTALEMNELDEAIKKDILEVRPDQIEAHLESFNEKRRELKRDLLHYSAYTIENETARDIIHQVLANNEFEADWFLKTILAEREENDSDRVVERFTGLSDAELSELAHEHFYSWIGPVGIMDRLYKIGALILVASVPKHLEKYVSEARWCYAFEQYLAVYSLSRTILETGIREVGQEVGKLPRDEENVKQSILRKFHKMKEKVVPSQLMAEVEDIYYPACGLIHGNITVGEKEANTMLRKTLTVVQKLYEYYKVDVGEVNLKQ
jgi:hypothetical protein